MISASDLSDEQIDMIKNWVAEGAQMADVQKRITDEFALKVTYMDTRFIALDLGLEFESQEEDAPEKVEKSPENEATRGSFDPSGEMAAPAGAVMATLDQVARPGAMVSGTVTFSDGMKGIWLIDEMGRPSIDPDQPGYQPTEADLIAFQGEMRRLLDGAQ